MDEILKYIKEVQQPRSRFQIENFVLGQHDTVEMQFYQLCIELQSTITAIRKSELDVKKAKIRSSRLKDSSDEIDQIEAEEIDISIEQAELALIGANRELEIMLDIWNIFETKFTRKQIEESQQEYWKARLFRQADSQALGQGFVEMAQIDALRQAGILEEFVEKHNNRIGGGNDIRNLEA
jgi:hypothetical protein